MTVAAEPSTLSDSEIETADSPLSTESDQQTQKNLEQNRQEISRKVLQYRENIDQNWSDQYKTRYITSLFTQNYISWDNLQFLTDSKNISKISADNIRQAILKNAPDFKARVQTLFSKIEKFSENITNPQIFTPAYYQKYIDALYRDGYIQNHQKDILRNVDVAHRADELIKQISINTDPKFVKYEESSREEILECAGISNTAQISCSEEDLAALDQPSIETPSDVSSIKADIAILKNAKSILAEKISAGGQADINAASSEFLLNLCQLLTQVNTEEIFSQVSADLKELITPLTPDFSLSDVEYLQKSFTKILKGGNIPAHQKKSWLDRMKDGLIDGVTSFFGSKTGRIATVLAVLLVVCESMAEGATIPGGGDPTLGATPTLDPVLNPIGSDRMSPEPNPGQLAAGEPLDPPGSDRMSPEPNPELAAGEPLDPPGSDRMSPEPNPELAASDPLDPPGSDRMSPEPNPSGSEPPALASNSTGEGSATEILRASRELGGNGVAASAFGSLAAGGSHNGFTDPITNPIDTTAHNPSLLARVTGSSAETGELANVDPDQDFRAETGILANAGNQSVRTETIPRTPTNTTPNPLANVGNDQIVRAETGELANVDPDQDFRAETGILANAGNQSVRAETIPRTPTNTTPNPLANVGNDQIVRADQTPGTLANVDPDQDFRADQTPGTLANVDPDQDFRADQITGTLANVDPDQDFRAETEDPLVNIDPHDFDLTSAAGRVNYIAQVFNIDLSQNPSLSELRTALTHCFPDSNIIIQQTGSTLAITGNTASGGTPGNIITIDQDFNLQFQTVSPFRATSSHLTASIPNNFSAIREFISGNSHTWQAWQTA